MATLTKLCVTEKKEQLDLHILIVLKKANRLAKMLNYLLLIYVLDKLKKVESEGKTDRYKRLIAAVYVNEICVNKEIVKNGFVWHFIKYSDNEEYAHLEKQARQNIVGLWTDVEPIAPWEWRKK